MDSACHYLYIHSSQLISERTILPLGLGGIELGEKRSILLSAVGICGACRTVLEHLCEWSPVAEF